MKLIFLWISVERSESERRQSSIEVRNCDNAEYGDVVSGKQGAYPEYVSLPVFRTTPTHILLLSGRCTGLNQELPCEMTPRSRRCEAPAVLLKGQN